MKFQNGVRSKGQTHNEQLGLLNIRHYLEMQQLTTRQQQHLNQTFNDLIMITFLGRIITLFVEPYIKHPATTTYPVTSPLTM